MTPPRILYMYCGVFTPCKNCNIETRSRDYATVDEAVFSPSRAEPSRVAHRVAWPRLVCCQATAIKTWMTQEWGSQDRVNSDATIKDFSRMSYQGFIGVRSRGDQAVLEEF
jgi:hypothetical protein